VRDALLAVARSHGARFQASARVERVLFDPKSGRASGVQLAGGERLAADAVVANADVAAALGLAAPPAAAASGGGGGAAAGGGGGGGGGGAAAGDGAARARYQHAARRARRLEGAEYR
jgi:hypothetical protein